MDKQANSVRMPPDRILPACVGAASRRRRYATRFKTTSLLLLAYARDRGAPARAGRADRVNDRRTDRRNLEFARAAVRLLRDTDGNTVQRTVPPTAPPPLTTTRTGWHWSSSSSRPGREEETTSRGDPARAATCVSRKPGSARQRKARRGRDSSRAGEVVGLMECKEGNRPLLPHPRASLTASRQPDLADTGLQLPNSREPEPR